MLIPAVAALHGIVLAAVHIDGESFVSNQTRPILICYSVAAVDMDVYGAFQFCAVGALAAPVTVKTSRTYFYDPGRNIIFVWSTLILAGLLSLIVEFLRIDTHPCRYDDLGNPTSHDPRQFIEDRASCGLTCSIGQGPVSPIRGGSGNNIYIIPAPSKLTFGAATLLAAACCLPVMLLLVR